MKVEPIEEYCLGKKVVVVVESLRPVRGEVRWFSERKAGIVFDQPLKFEELAEWIGKRLELATLKAASKTSSSRITAPFLSLGITQGGIDHGRGSRGFCGRMLGAHEAVFLDVIGVKSVESGYTGGHTTNPTYRRSAAATRAMQGDPHQF